MTVFLTNYPGIGAFSSRELPDRPPALSFLPTEPTKQRNMTGAFHLPKKDLLENVGGFLYDETTATLVEAEVPQ